MNLLARIITGMLIAALCATAGAQTYPANPIRLVVGYPGGGGADTVARLIAEPMARDLGQQIFIDNRPGAGATIAANFVVQSAPDGYTLFIGNDYLYGADRQIYNVAYDGARDFTHIARWVVASFVGVVSKDSGIRNVADLIARAKQNPKGLNYSSAGLGTGPHLAALYFSELAGIEITHVPYKGGAPAVQAVLTGEVQLTFSSATAVLPSVKAGRLVALGVTSRARSSMMPDTPALAEQGVNGFDLTYWAGLFGPRGVPAPIVERLALASDRALADPAVKEKLTSLGNEVAPSRNPREFEEFAIRTGRKTAELVRVSGAKID